jgi:hypothetical protein
MTHLNIELRTTLSRMADNNNRQTIYESMIHENGSVRRPDNGRNHNHNARRIRHLALSVTARSVNVATFNVG